jgi:O-antigen ligase
MLRTKFNIESIYNYLIMLLLVSFSLPDKVAPIVIIILLTLSLYIRIKKKIGFSNYLVFFYFSIFIYYALRLIGSPNFNLGVKFLEKNLIFVVGPIFIIPSIINNRDKLLKTFVIGFTLVSSFTMIMLVLDSLMGSNTTKWYFQNIENYGFHPTYMAMYAGVSLLILDRCKTFHSKHIRIIFIIINVLFIFFAASRIILLALFVLLVFRAVFFKKKKYLVLLSLVFSLCFLAYFSSNDFRFKINQLTAFRGFTYYDNNDYGSISLRVAKIKASYNVWQENLWFGVGTGALEEELIKQYRSKDIECWPCSQRRYNPHNQYLSVLSGHGVIGFGLFIFSIVFILYHAIKNRNFLLIEIVIIFLLTALTESILERQKGVLIFVVLTYLIFTVNKNITKNKALNNQ